MDFPGKNTGVGCHILLQGMFPTQELNLGLLHCRQTLYFTIWATREALILTMLLKWYCRRQNRVFNQQKTALLVARQHSFPISLMAQWERIRLPSKRCRFDPWVGTIPWRRKWQPTLVCLAGKSHGQRSLVGYSPWGCERVGHDLATK